MRSRSAWPKRLPRLHPRRPRLSASTTLHRTYFAKAYNRTGTRHDNNTGANKGVYHVSGIRKTHRRCEHCAGCAGDSRATNAAGCSGDSPHIERAGLVPPEALRAKISSYLQFINSALCLRKHQKNMPTNSLPTQIAISHHSVGYCASYLSTNYHNLSTSSKAR